MISCTIDLAAKFSAGVVMKRTKGVDKVLHQFDSWGKSQKEFVAESIDAAKRYKVDVFGLEDVPYGLSKQFMIKPALRLQGRFIEAIENNGLEDITVFINPATWQRTFDGVYGGGKDGAEKAALGFGYVAPNMLEVHDAEIPPSGKERTAVRQQLKKATTDYNDAFLMGKFVQSFKDIDDMLQYVKKGIQKI